MKWRSIYGVVIGCLEIFFLLRKIIFLSRSLNENIETCIKQIIYIVLCVALIIICGLMIVGITVRRYKLMMPWTIVTGIAFFVGCLIVLANPFLEFFKGTSMLQLGSDFVKDLFLLIIVTGISLPIFKEFSKIMGENMKMSTEEQQNIEIGRNDK